MDKDAEHLVLAGNPNVGKSVFFHALTGMYVDVSNFPGTTVDISRGKYNNYVVEDTPGVYGVSSFNDEEKVARDVILQADVVLNVVDAVHLQRDLFLTQQLLDMGKNVIVALNMMDEVSKNGILIDVNLLTEWLGVPVIPTAALQNKGMKEVKQQIEFARQGNKTEGMEQLLQPYIDQGIVVSEAVMILEDDPTILERNNEKEKGLREEIYKRRRIRVDQIVAQVVSETDQGARISTRLGRMMLRPWTGIPILLVTLIVMFLFIGVFIAQIIVQITEKQIMIGWYQQGILSFVGQWISIKSVLGQIIIGDYGLLTMLPVYLVGLLLPLVIGFYFMLSLLEDSGYLPRIAALVDRSLTGIGLNGRAIIPIILGFGCITMATMTTRMLGSRRERVIATVLLGLTIPCSAQLGVIAGLLTPLGPLYIAIYCAVMLLLFGGIGAALHKLLPGESTDLMIDLPPIRIPVAMNIIKKTTIKTKAFMLEATPLFAAGALVISIMQITGLLTTIQKAIAPIITGWLGLPKEAATVFIMGMIRRDFGAAGLSKLILSPSQMLVALVTITIFVPCIASVIVIFKERTRMEGILIWIGSFTMAFLIGGILAHVLMIFT